MENHDKPHGTHCLIHRENLIHNLNQIRKELSPEIVICPAVKADAYGHGAVEVSRILKEQGVSHLSVARVKEGAVLRESGIEGPILLLSHCDPLDIPQLISNDLSPFVSSREYIKALVMEGEKQNRQVNVHLKIDTGMGRLGCSPNQALEISRYIEGHPFLNLEGTCTHFPVSDSEDQEDRNFTNAQLRLFTHTVQSIKEAGIDPGLLHSSNSGAILFHQESRLNMIRPGIMLYGYSPSGTMPEGVSLKPVMEFRCPVIHIKQVKKGTALSYGRTWKAKEDCRIATLAVGYADGYSRSLSNRGEVWIRGKRYPIAGRVCMDQILINLGSESSVKTGDFATLFGPEEGQPDGWEIARMLDTIPYEVTCAVNFRVKRYLVN